MGLFKLDGNLNLMIQNFLYFFNIIIMIKFINYFHIHTFKKIIKIQILKIKSQNIILFIKISDLLIHYK